jgi:hypothetical protein
MRTPALLGAALLSAGSLAAQPSRPLRSPAVVPPRFPQELPAGELTFVQQRGETQLTLGSRLDGDRRALQLPLSIEYGLTDRWQLDTELELEPATDAGEPTHGAATVGLQRGWLGLGGGRTHAAAGLEIGVGLGVGGRAPMTYRPGAGIVRVLHAAIGLQLTADVGLAVGAEAGEVEEPEPLAASAEPRASDGRWPGRVEGAIGVVASLPRSFASLELAWGARAWGIGGATTADLVPGVTWLLLGSELTAGVPLPLRGASHAPGAVVKLTREF